MDKPQGRIPALLPAPQIIEWRGGGASPAPVTWIDKKPLFHQDSYRIDIAGAGVEVSAESSNARRFAESTLAQLHCEAEEFQSFGSLSIQDYPALEMRGLHLDLKFTPPRFDWLISWLDQLAGWKLNTVIVEYEDKFPFRRASGIADKNAWTREQVRLFVERANEIGIQVIPLIQTLGHLEYVLHNERYAGLREQPRILSQACPSNPGTFDLVTTMLDEVLELHPESEYIHIGADETVFLGSCDACAGKAGKLGGIGLYAEYIAEVCAWVERRGLRPMLWDDILRKDIKNVERLPKSAALVYWNYGCTDEKFDGDKREPWSPADEKPPYVRYREAGYDVLMAPCFTGGGLVPDVAALAANCRFHAKEAALHGCMGVAATSWASLFTPMALSSHAVAALADAAWNPLPGSRERLDGRRPSISDEFDRRFCKHYFGLPDDTIIHALRLMSANEMFAPGGDVYPTYYSEPMFVDASFNVDRETFAALGCIMSFRPDWAEGDNPMDFARAWQAKVEAMRNHETAGYIRALAGEQLLRCGKGLALLRDELPRVKKKREFVEGLEIAAEARLFRLEHLLRELAGEQCDSGKSDIGGRLESLYAQSMSKDDAKLLAEWLLMGLPR